MARAKYKLETFIQFSTAPEGAETDAPLGSGVIDGIVTRKGGYSYFVKDYNYSYAERRPGGSSEQWPQQEIPESKVVNAYRAVPTRKTAKKSTKATHTKRPTTETTTAAQ